MGQPLRTLNDVGICVSVAAEWERQTGGADLNYSERVRPPEGGKGHERQIRKARQFWQL